MNLLDFLILGLCISAGLGGFRIGLVTRSLSWFGMAIGLIFEAAFRSYDPWLLHDNLPKLAKLRKKTQSLTETSIGTWLKSRWNAHCLKYRGF